MLTVSSQILVYEKVLHNLFEKTNLLHILTTTTKDILLYLYVAKISFNLFNYVQKINQRKHYREKYLFTMEKNN